MVSTLKNKEYPYNFYSQVFEGIESKKYFYKNWEFVNPMFEKVIRDALSLDEWTVFKAIYCDGIKLNKLVTDKEFSTEFKNLYKKSIARTLSDINEKFKNPFLRARLWNKPYRERYGIPDIDAFKMYYASVFNEEDFGLPNIYNLDYICSNSFDGFHIFDLISKNDMVEFYPLLVFMHLKAGDRYAIPCLVLRHLYGHSDSYIAKAVGLKNEEDVGQSIDAFTKAIKMLWGNSFRNYLENFSIESDFATKINQAELKLHPYFFDVYDFLKYNSLIKTPKELSCKSIEKLSDYYFADEIVYNKLYQAGLLPIVNKLLDDIGVYNVRKTSINEFKFSDSVKRKLYEKGAKTFGDVVRYSDTILMDIFGDEYFKLEALCNFFEIGKHIPYQSKESKDLSQRRIKYIEMEHKKDLTSKYALFKTYSLDDNISNLNLDSNYSEILNKAGIHTMYDLVTTKYYELLVIPSMTEELLKKLTLYV